MPVKFNPLSGNFDMDSPSDVNRAYVDAADALRVTKTDVGPRLYGTDNAGGQALLTYADNPSNLTIPRRVSGGQTLTGEPVLTNAATTKLYVDNLAPIYGTGFPNGVVTASPGRIYIDTNVTNGASVWIKKSGTGNTGWVVLEGNTGWRNITQLLLNGWGEYFAGMTLFVCRDAGAVYLKVDGIKSATMTNGYFLALPAGFRPTGSNCRFILHSLGVQPSNVYRGYVDTSGAAVMSSATTSFGDLFGEFDFLTTSAWPTTLPGTAV